MKTRNQQKRVSIAGLSCIREDGTLDDGSEERRLIAEQKMKKKW